MYIWYVYDDALATVLSWNLTFTNYDPDTAQELIPLLKISVCELF
jgi:IS1 family transposase